MHGRSESFVSLPELLADIFVKGHGSWRNCRDQMGLTLVTNSNLMPGNG